MSGRGASIGAKMDAYSRQAEQGVVTHKIRTAANGPAVTSSFPRGGLESRDYKRDEILRMKAEMLKEGGGGGQTRLGQVMLSDDDLVHLQQKQQTEIEADFDAWAGSNFHTDDPAMRRWFQTIYPRYYKIRDEQMINKAKFALRVNRLLEHGAQDEEDLLLQWGLSTGHIQLEPGWNIIGYNNRNPDMDKEQKKFASRLMGQRRYKSQEERRTAANREFKGQKINPFAPGADNALGQFPAPFSGTVPDNNRFTAFMNRILANPPAAAPAQAPVAAGNP